MDKKVLVVDDEIEILVSFKKMLQRSGFFVDTAETIEEAETLLKGGGYDVVIADLRLTGVLGEEGLEIIRYVQEHQLKSKVILITGYGNPDIKAKAYELGAALYIEKPVSVKERMLRKIRRMIMQMTVEVFQPLDFSVIRQKLPGMPGRELEALFQLNDPGHIYALCLTCAAFGF